MQRSIRPTRTARTPLAVLAIVIATLAIVSTFAAPTAVAQDDGAPLPPAAFYGNVTVDGEPAPAGTDIVAYVDGERRGSIVTDERGTYGGPNVVDEKLTVDGSSADAGATVTFRVDGERVDQTATWQFGGVTRLDLGESAGEDPGGDGPGGNTESGDGGTAIGDGGTDSGDGIGVDTTTDATGADSDADETDARATSDGQAGFGPGVVLLAVVLLARFHGPRERR